MYLLKNLFVFIFVFFSFINWGFCVESNSRINTCKNFFENADFFSQLSQNDKKVFLNVIEEMEGDVLVQTPFLSMSEKRKKHLKNLLQNLSQYSIKVDENTIILPIELREKWLRLILAEKLFIPVMKITESEFPKLNIQRNNLRDFLASYPFNSGELLSNDSNAKKIIENFSDDILMEFNLGMEDDATLGFKFALSDKDYQQLLADITKVLNTINFQLICSKKTNDPAFLTSSFKISEVISNAYIKAVPPE
ncbi:MAG: hypothetical protein LBF88_09025 [Planctomycetaceae bacterium]|jgi:hypothetical protein|nr:hypothetical protein [Planctomycetaceae bacterium]